MKTAEPSLKTIAEQAGVSVATANQILNGHTDRFAGRTCALVQKTAKRMGYQPNLAARALRQNRSFLVGVLFSEANGPLLSDFARGIVRGLRGRDYSPIIFSPQDAREESEHLDLCRLRRVDGLVVNPSLDLDGMTNAQSFAKLVAAGTPMVEVFSHILPGANSITFDLAATARTAVEHLLSLGHRTIALVTHDGYAFSVDAEESMHFDAWRQFQGYEQALRDAGGTPQVVTRPLQPAPVTGEVFSKIGYDASAELLTPERRPSAVICYNDEVAWGVCQACRERGLSVPEDIAVVGFGDDKISRLSWPPLTTFRRAIFDVAETAIKILLQSMNEDYEADLVLTPELIVRESTNGR